MPSFDLRGIKIAQYVNTAGTITYTTPTTIGDAISVDLQMKFAEGRLYAESTLAEYMKKAVGGSISIAEKYIPTAAQKLLFGVRDSSRTVGTGTTTTVAGVKLGAGDSPKAVGVAFYCPDMIDGAQKYTCVFIRRAIFGYPAMSVQTLGENIQFATPTCTGEFMADHSTTQEMLEVATADTEADAKAWVTAVLV